MNFDESLKYLSSLGGEVSAMKLGLENIRILLAALGNPEKKYLKVQVAGTNGKGSTCAFLEAICLAANIKTGLTTSPHLVSITERIRINGKEIGEEDFARRAALIKEVSEKLVEERKLESVPTFFEQVTAIALHAFAEASVELAILETGLGGRLDAVTAANAEIVGVAPIDFDHQRILGDTIEKIAAEKAAIIREGVKVVAAKQRRKALEVILRRCASFGLKPNLTQKVTMNKKGCLSNGFQVLNFRTEKADYENVRLSLLGKHQIENAKTAVLLAETLQDNFKITAGNIIEGLQSAEHKGRLEFYENYLFDGAHNVAGAKALREFLDEFVQKPITMIFGAMRDKNLAEIARILFPKADKLILTVPDNARSLKIEELSNFAPKGCGEKKVYLTETVEAALTAAQTASSENDLICVTGSLYLVGEAQKILKNQSEI